MSFHPSVTQSATQPSVQYDSFSFQRTTINIDEHGKAKIIRGDAQETILVACDWQKEIGGGESRAGYLGYGFSKYAFKGRLGPKEYAILQSKPKLSSSAGNKNDLLDELALLGLGQYFLTTFFKRADDYPEAKKLLPSMRWNAPDAFVGTVSAAIPPGPSSRETDSRTLLFPDFLATSLLPSGSQYREVKFSGNADIGNNTDPVGEAVDAYAHHTVADSFGDVLFADLQGIVGPDDSVVLFDPQAHTIFDSGYWDKGHGMIHDFLRRHTCNHICKKLKLPEATGALKAEIKAPKAADS